MNKFLLNSQRNVVFNLIVDNDLEPANFILKTALSSFDSNDIVSLLSYNGTDFFFKFDFYKDGHYVMYSPAEDKIIGRDYPGAWNEVIGYLTQWLYYLKREINATDPWLEIEKYIPGWKVNLESGEINEQFSFSQVDHITKSLNKLREQIVKNYKLNTQQSTLVQNKLDYLVDRAKKVGRIDWKNIFVSTIIGIAFDLAMNVEQVKLLWNLVKTCFKGVLFLGG